MPTVQALDIPYPTICQALLLFTTAFLAVAQYYDNRHATMIQKGKERLMVLDFSKGSENNGMLSVKKMWDNAQETEPINSFVIIVSLFLLMVIYLVVFSVGISWSWMPCNQDSLSFFVINSLRLLAFILVFASGWLATNLVTMNQQLKKFNTAVESCDSHYNVAKQAMQ